MRSKGLKRFSAVLLAACIAWPPMASLAEDTPKSVTVPDPYYEFTFDEEVEGTIVSNQGTKEGVTAEIGGNGEGLGIVEDDQRASKVLNLPGGGLGKGY